MAPEKASGIIQHAAECPHCARILRTFSEDFSDDLTPEELASEKEWMSQLNSSSPKWQKDMASHAMKANRGSATASDRRNSSMGPQLDSGSKSSGWFPRWILTPAALAACAAIAFAVWFTQRDTPEKVEKLLAQAYTEQRTMEYRWPGAEWGPVRVTRGRVNSAERSPLQLLEAEKVLQDKNAAHSENPAWLSAVGELELLQGQPQMAIEELNRAISLGQHSSRTRLLLAMAYAQLGTANDDHSALEKAADQLTQLLNSNNVDRATALYNRCLVYRQLKMDANAATDWRAFREIEHQNQWVNESPLAR